MPEEPEHETSEDCWCLPHIETLKHDDGPVSFIIVHNRITDEPKKENREQNT